MKKVFRVELNGIGPYISGFGKSITELLSHERSKNNCLKTKTYFRPGLHNDSLPPENLFGFQSKKKLKRWFPLSLRKKLKDAGFVLAVYKSPCVILGESGKQCVFEASGYPKIRDLTKI